MSPQVRSESGELVQMAALTDALVRSGPREAAVVATDRLAGALLGFSRRSRTADTANPAAREALRLRAEALVLGRRLRFGPVRLAPVFAWRVRQLVDVGEPTGRAG
jgi:hypothetical protein